MKLLKSVTALIFIALMSVIISTIFSFSFYAVALALVAASFMKMPVGSFMSVTVEIWTKDIVDNLFKNNDFAKRAFSEDQYVIGGAVVHIPTAGAPSGSIKNNDT